MTEPYIFEERKNKGRKQPSDYVMFNQDPTKPNVGNKPTVEALVESLRTKINILNKEMATLQQAMRRDEVIDLKKVDKFQELNNQLKGVKIYEAQMVYLKNML